jgi:hypothetical protein
MVANAQVANAHGGKRPWWQTPRWQTPWWQTPINGGKRPGGQTPCYRSELANQQSQIRQVNSRPKLIFSRQIWVETDPTIKNTSDYISKKINIYQWLKITPNIKP